MTTIEGGNGQNVHECENDGKEGGHLPEEIPVPYRWEEATYGSETTDRLSAVGSKHIFHIANVAFQYIPSVSNASVYDNNTLKKAIKNYGAVATSIYWGGSYESTSNYYCGVSKDCNHAITVVGWDDNYSTNNFKTAPVGNGAWLIKNSWGTSNGDKGYYHVSYYDRNFAIWEGYAK